MKNSVILRVISLSDDAFKPIESEYISEKKKQLIVKFNLRLLRRGMTDFLSHMHFLNIVYFLQHL